MMDWTDRHCRYFHRVLTPDALLYTEMVTAPALIHGDTERLLQFNAAEHPVALQIGGSEPEQLKRAARLGEDAGYDEINLNVGCPSDRVQKGRFGACLMREPELVAECLSAMRSAVSVPVTIKCRIGVDDQDTEQTLDHFVDTVRQSGTDCLIIHARKAWLKGLSPTENRDVPPLDYPRVHRLKRDFPDLEIILNGGLETTSDCLGALQHLDGVMIGRSAYKNPWWLSQLQGALFDREPPDSRSAVIQALLPYLQQQCAQGVPLKSMTRHILGLFQGRPGARSWRRTLSEQARLESSSPALLLEANPELESNMMEVAADRNLCDKGVST